MDQLNEQLVPAMLAEPDLLPQIVLEHIQDPLDAAIITWMLELKKQGVKPTLNGLRHDMREMPRLLEALEARALIDVIQDPSYILANLRKDFNDRTMFEMLNSGLRMLQEHGWENADAAYMEGRKRLTGNVKAQSMAQASINTMAYLKAIYAGERPPNWKTGQKRLDAEVGFSMRQLVMTAAQSGIGKTRLTVCDAMGLMKYQPNIKVDWYTFEVHPTEIVMCMIGNLTGIDTRVISGKLRIPTMEEQQLIMRAQTLIDQLPIRWFNDPCPVEDIQRNTDNNTASEKLVIIDNVNLVRNDKGMDELAFDKHIATTLVETRDSSDALILALHHLSKASEGHFNKADLYEPQTTHIRGSQKWVDCVNTLQLLHRVDYYPQLKRMMTPQQWDAAKGKIQRKFAKVRDGGTTEIMSTHGIENCRFVEIEKPEPETDAPEA